MVSDFTRSWKLLSIDQEVSYSDLSMQGYKFSLRKHILEQKKDIAYLCNLRSVTDTNDS